MTEHGDERQPLLRVRGLEQRFQAAGGGLFGGPPRFLQAGETIDSWIEGIGTIRNRCR